MTFEQRAAPPPYNFEHHMEFAEQWERASRRSLLRLSDWNADQNEVEVPLDLVNQAINESLNSITRYAETAVLLAVCEDIQRNLADAYGLTLGRHTRLHLFGNATQAIFATLYALSQTVSRPCAAIVHPSYYSVQDSARQCGIPFVEIWRRQNEGFAIRFDRIEQSRRKHHCNILIVTDPVYSVGRSLTDAEWVGLLDYCQALDLWLVVDLAFSGLSWIDDRRAWIDSQRLSHGTYRKVVLIDSPSKRLFTNNLKIGVVVTDIDLIEPMRNFSDWHLGNLTGLQLAFARNLFVPEQRGLLERLCQRNASRALRNFRQLEMLIQHSPKLSVITPDSGFHAMMFARGSVSRHTDAMASSSKWITTLETLAVPTNDFFFAPEDELGFRVNLMHAPHKWEKVIRHVAIEGFPM